MPRSLASRAPHAAARVIAASAAALVLGGALACQAAVEKVFTPPAVTFRGVRLHGVTVGGGMLDVTLAVHNPNPYALTATHATYRVLVQDSVEIGRGATTDTIHVGARDSATVRLPIELTWPGMQAAARAALRDGAVDYRITGDIVASTPIGPHTFPLDARGRAQAPGIR